MKMKRITRPLRLKGIEENGSFEGYGSVFNVADSYKEVVLPGAFNDSIARFKESGGSPALLWQHQPHEPIGRFLEFSEDGHGLFLKGELFINDNVPMADKAYTLMRKGAVTGLSIGFSVPDGGEHYDQEKGLWMLSKIDLWETSVVTFPANQSAQVTAIRADEAIGNIREFEAFLRDAGLSKTQAKALLSGGYSAIQKRDVDEDGEIEAINLLKKSLETLRGTQL